MFWQDVELLKEFLVGKIFQISLIGKGYVAFPDLCAIILAIIPNYFGLKGGSVSQLIVFSH